MQILITDISANEQRLTSIDTLQGPLRQAAELLERLALTEFDPAAGLSIVIEFGHYYVRLEALASPGPRLVVNH